MVDVKEFLKEAGGTWLRAEYVQVGDKLEILGQGKVDDETFDSPYLVIPVRLQRTGEEYNARLGAKNATRLADTFGTSKTEDWVGRHAEVVSIETYKGLGTKGYILRGLPREPAQITFQPQAQPQPQPSSGEVSKETLDAIWKSRDIINMGMALNETDFNLLPAAVRAELVKKGLIEQREGLYTFTEAARKILKTQESQKYG
ncbi:MAG: hypothetical protein ACE5NN_06940 [Candidatus Bathyarchaeia archaeon]